MLQQTQVERVLPKYREFLKKFPTLTSLAKAPVAAVIRCWCGLGYNQRAVYLHRAARLLIERNGGKFPRVPVELQKFPGVGPYTAGAVAIFACNRDVVMLDTNIRRVLTRVFAGQRPVSEKKLHKLAFRLLPAGRSKIWHSALMDLGALLCTTRNPKCPLCSVQRDCLWYRESQRKPRPASRPARRKQPPFRNSTRFWRGRIVAALRELSNGRKFSLFQLGKRIKPNFKTADLPWLKRLATALVRDGLATQSGRQISLPT